MVVMVLFVVGCAASNDASTAGISGKRAKKVKAYDPTGTWEYSVETPDGANGGNFIIGGNPGAYTASLETDQFGTLQLENVDVQGTSMTGDIEVM